MPNRDASNGSASAEASPPKQKKRGWREVEAWRERKFLRDNLADIWDEDLLIDESLFASTEFDVEFYTDSEEITVEDDFEDEFDEDFDDEDFYEDED